VERLEQLAAVGFVVAGGERGGKGRWGTRRDVDRAGRGWTRDEADGDALQGRPLPRTLTPGPSPASGRGVNSGGCEMPEPRSGGRLVVTWVEALAFDGDAGFAKIAEPAGPSGAASPRLAEHPGGDPTGGSEMPADLPAVGAAVALGEEVVDAGGRAGDGTAAR
jgi:hypothetical protein